MERKLMEELNMQTEYMLKQKNKGVDFSHG